MTKSDAAVLSPRRSSGQSLVLAVCATLIDLAAAMALAFAIVLLGGRALAPLAFTFGVAALVATAWGLLARGVSLGWALAGVRLISAESGSAPGIGTGGGWAIADIRRFGDPIAPYAPVPDLRLLSPQPYRVPTALLASRGSASSADRAAEESEPTPVGAPEQAAAPSSDGAPAPASVPAPAPARTQAAVPESAAEAHGETMIYRSKLRQGTSVLVIDGERTVMVTARMVVGRNPSAEAGEVPVAIPDMSRDLSKNHLRVEQDADGQLVVTDLGSTNGTRLRSLDGARRKLRPHLSTVVAWGESLELGTQHVVQFESRVRVDEREQHGE